METTEDLRELLTVNEGELIDVLGHNPFENNSEGDGVQEEEMRSEGDVGVDQTGTDNDGTGNEVGAGSAIGAEVEVGAESDRAGSESESDEGSKSPGSKRKKKRTSPEKPKVKNQRFFRSLSSLSSKARKLSEESGVKIYFKGRYVSTSKDGQKGKVTTFQAGSDFEIQSGEPIVAANFERMASISDVRSAIQDLLSSPPTFDQSTSSAQKETPTTSQSLFRSPFRPKSRTAESDCEKRVCQFHSLDQQTAAWVGCDFKTSNIKCPYWIHAACLGFPEVKPSDVTSLPRYFCPEHIQIIGATLIPSPTETVAPPALPKRGRGSRGGRGARRNLGPILESQDA